MPVKIIPFLDPCSHFLCAVRLTCPAAYRRDTRPDDRRMIARTPLGEAGASPSRQADYFRIDPEIE
jgi:hypothetical protein